MKYIFKGILIFILTFTIATPVKANEYPSLLRIDKVEDYLITGTDVNGNEFSRIDCREDWEVDDFAAVIFDDNGTPNYIYDDAIKDMRYVGCMMWTY